MDTDGNGGKREIYQETTYIQEVKQENKLFLNLFCNKLCYLGTIFTPDLSDTADISNRLNKANSALGQLRSFIFFLKYVSLLFKQTFYILCVVNTLLWGGENWVLHA